MPKITFINEHRSVEAAPGRLLSEIAAEHGIKVCRESFVGTGIGDYTVWVRGETGSLSPAGFFERLLGARGRKRFANRVRVLGDVEVWTQPGLDDRLRVPRPIAPPPRPTEDPSAPRKPIDAAGSAAFPYGDPRAVGKGERPPVARSTAKPNKTGVAAKGKATANADSEGEEAEA